MNKRQAKRHAFHRAALVVQNALDAGWELNDLTEEEDVKVRVALDEVIGELFRRGWATEREIAERNSKR